MTLTTGVPIVYGMSDVERWKRCRRAHYYATQLNIEPTGVNEAISKGVDFHSAMELLAKPGAIIATDNPMRDVALEYVRHRPLPKVILAAEEPFYTFVTDYEDHPVYIRTTLDLVYMRGDVIVGRDYKTFAAAPTLDLELDFQGRIYTCALREYLRQRNTPNRVEFEWEYVRREVGRQLKKGYEEWPVSERYINVPVVMSDIEIGTTMMELSETIMDMVRSDLEQRYYRTELKVGPHSCSMCEYNTICKAEYAHGLLSETDLELLSRPSDPAERATKKSIISDPRVRHLLDLDGDEARAIERVYGAAGLEKVYGKETASA